MSSAELAFVGSVLLVTGRTFLPKHSCSQTSIFKPGLHRRPCVRTKNTEVLVELADEDEELVRGLCFNVSAALNTH